MDIQCTLLNYAVHQQTHLYSVVNLKSTIRQRGTEVIHHVTRLIIRREERISISLNIPAVSYTGLASRPFCGRMTITGGLQAPCVGVYKTPYMGVHKLSTHGGSLDVLRHSQHRHKNRDRANKTISRTEGPDCCL